MKRNYNGCTCTHSDKRSKNLCHENQTIVVVSDRGSVEAQLQCLRLHHSDKRYNDLSHENQTIVVKVEKGSGTMAALAPTLPKGQTIEAMIIKQLLLYLTMDIAKRNYNVCACTHSDKRSNDLGHENQTIVVVVRRNLVKCNNNGCACAHSDKRFRP